MKNLYAKVMLIMGVGIIGFSIVLPTRATAIGNVTQTVQEKRIMKQITKENQPKTNLEKSATTTLALNAKNEPAFKVDPNTPNIIDDLAAQQKAAAEQQAQAEAEEKAAQEKQAAQVQQTAATNATSTSTEFTSAATVTGGRQVLMNTSAYDAFSIGTGLTASGYRMSSASDKVVAAGPAYPFGTKIYIPGYGTATVVDRGSGISNDHLDLQMPYADSLQWGRRFITVTILG